MKAPKDEVIKIAEKLFRVKLGRCPLGRIRVHNAQIEMFMLT